MALAALGLGFATLVHAQEPPALPPGGPGAAQDEKDAHPSPKAPPAKDADPAATPQENQPLAPEPPPDPDLIGPPIEGRGLPVQSPPPPRESFNDEAPADSGEGELGENPTTPRFIVPGFYGSTPREFSTSTGRFLGPRFRASANIGLGYDDNIYQSADGSGRPKIASAFTTVGLNASYQTAGRLSFTVVDASASADVYWEQGSPDYNFDLGLTHHRRFLAPSELTANVRLAYLSQPDYSQPGVFPVDGEEEDENANQQLLASAKIDYSYRWTPQFSTLSSLAGNTVLYNAGGSGSGSARDFTSFTAGNEFRYRSGRFTWIAEARYEMTFYPDASEEDATTFSVLGGAEWRLGPWLQVSARAGASSRESGALGRNTGPHVEFAATFQPKPWHSFGFNARYGFENSGVRGGSSKTFRTGLSYRRTLTPRLNGTIQASYGNSEGESGTDGGSDTFFNGSLSFGYRLSSHVSLAASLTTTKSKSSGDQGSMSHNRVTVTANYEF